MILPNRLLTHESSEALIEAEYEAMLFPKEQNHNMDIEEIVPW